MSFIKFMKRDCINKSLDYWNKKTEYKPGEGNGLNNAKNRKVERGTLHNAINKLLLSDLIDLFIAYMHTFII